MHCPQCMNECISVWKNEREEKKLPQGGGFGFGSRVESKSKSWKSHSLPINGMWLSKISSSISKSIGMRINVGSGNGFKLCKETRVNIDSKIEIESQSCESGSHSYSSLILLKWKLAKFGIDQV